MRRGFTHLVKHIYFWQGKYLLQLFWHYSEGRKPVYKRVEDESTTHVCILLGLFNHSAPDEDVV